VHYYHILFLFYTFFFQKIHLLESSSKNSRFIWLLRLRRNNQIEFMNLPKSGYGPIKNLDLRNPFEIKGGSVQEIKSYINDRSFEGPENAMRCSEMVEVVE